MSRDAPRFLSGVIGDTVIDKGGVRSESATHWGNHQVSEISAVTSRDSV